LAFVHETEEIYFMIQRIQTIWLLLATACIFLSLKFPFYSGTTNLLTFKELNGFYNIVLTILTVIVGTIAGVSIFLFKNRPLQTKLTFLGIVLQVVCLYLYFNKMNDFINGNLSLGSIFSFAVIFLFVLALLGINKDRKLIKSLDRLR